MSWIVLNRTIKFSTYFLYSTGNIITMYYITMAYISMVYITMAYITIVYITMVYIVMVYITMVYITIDYITMVYRGHPRYSSSALDCWPTSRAIDPAPVA